MQGQLSYAATEGQGWKQGGRKDGAEEKDLDLERGEEHRIIVGSIIRKSVIAGFGTKESKLISRKSVQISFT